MVMSKYSRVMMKSFGLSLVVANALVGADLQLVEIEESALKSTDSSLSVETANQHILNVIKPKSLSDLSGVFANTNISGLGGRGDQTLSVRGVSNYLTAESSVAVYIDDIPLPFKFWYGVLPVGQIQSISLLKGPQGTLFGRNAESGVMVVRSFPLKKEGSASLSYDVGSYAKNHLSVSINGSSQTFPLEWFLNGYVNKQEGFVENTTLHNMIDSRKDQGISGKVVYRFSPMTTMDINYMSQRIDDGGVAYSYDTKENPYRLAAPYNGYLKMDNDLLGVRFKHTYNDYLITAIASYASQKLLKQAYFGVSGGILLDNDISIKQLHGEVKLQRITDTAEYVLGSSYATKTSYGYNENVRVLLAPSYNQTWNLNLPDKVFSIFGQTTQWLTSNWGVTVGGRLETNQREFDRRYTGYLMTGDATVEKTEKAFLPMVSVTYKNSDDRRSYLSYSEGYRPFGYNYRNSEVSPLAFKKELTESFEVGHKYDGKLMSYHVAGFYNKIHDLRINTLNDSLASILLTAPQAHAYGVEGNINYVLDDRLKLFGSFGLTRTCVDELVYNGTDYKGKNLVDIPDMTAMVGNHYRFDEGYFFSSNIRYIGKRYYEMENNRGQGGYGVVGLSAGRDVRKFNFSLYVHNLFDRRYTDTALATPNHTYYHFGAPRMVGVKASLSF